MDESILPSALQEADIKQEVVKSLFYCSYSGDYLREQEYPTLFGSLKKWKGGGGIFAAQEEGAPPSIYFKISDIPERCMDGLMNRLHQHTSALSLIPIIMDHFATSVSKAEYPELTSLFDSICSHSGQYFSLNTFCGVEVGPDVSIKISPLNNQVLKDLVRTKVEKFLVKEKDLMEFFQSGSFDKKAHPILYGAIMKLKEENVKGIEITESDDGSVRMRTDTNLEGFVKALQFGSITEQHLARITELGAKFNAECSTEAKLEVLRTDFVPDWDRCFPQRDSVGKMTEVRQSLLLVFNPKERENIKKEESQFFDADTSINPWTVDINELTRRGRKIIERYVLLLGHRHTDLIKSNVNFVWHFFYDEMERRQFSELEHKQLMECVERRSKQLDRVVDPEPEFITKPNSGSQEEERARVTSARQAVAQELDGIVRNMRKTQEVFNVGQLSRRKDSEVLDIIEKMGYYMNMVGGIITTELGSDADTMKVRMISSKSVRDRVVTEEELEQFPTQFGCFYNPTLYRCLSEGSGTKGVRVQKGEEIRSIRIGGDECCEQTVCYSGMLTPDIEGFNDALRKALQKCEVSQKEKVKEEFVRHLLIKGYTRKSERDPESELLIEALKREKGIILKDYDLMIEILVTPDLAGFTDSEGFKSLVGCVFPESHDDALKKEQRKLLRNGCISFWDRQMCIDKRGYPELARFMEKECKRPGIEVVGTDEALCIVDIRIPELSSGINTRLLSGMSHLCYYNFGIYPLWIMQSSDYRSQAERFFGHTIGGSNGTHILCSSYSFTKGESQGGAGGVEGANDSDSILTIGLHVEGSNSTTMTEGYNVLQSGEGSVGIRVDGWCNHLFIRQGTKIYSDGKDGTGIMFCYGHGHSAVVEGEIRASGDDGIGIRIDFGDNVFGNTAEYRGSYIRRGLILFEEGFVFETSGRTPEQLPLLGELRGPLVKHLVLSGRVEGSQAAIYMSRNAYAKDICICQGAQMIGDIFSDWDPLAEFVQRPDGEALHTKLSFGLAVDSSTEGFRSIVDSNYSGIYRGNIKDSGHALEVSLDGGILEYQGRMTGLARFDVRAGATLKVATNVDVKSSSPTCIIEAQQISFAAGSELLIDFYHLPSVPQTVLELKSTELIELDDSCVKCISTALHARIEVQHGIEYDFEQPTSIPRYFIRVLLSRVGLDGIIGGIAA